MPVKMGFACKLFRNSGVNYASPTWLEVKIVKDVTLNLEDGEEDAATRGAGGWQQDEPGLRKAGLEFQIPLDTSDANYTALRDAYLARAFLDLAALDGPASGGNSQGLRAIMKIFKFSRGEPLNGVATVDVTIKPCYEVTNPPAWSTFT